MPTSIDNKVVEMKFDNKDFEKNTKQSMATLEKLKTSLDMSDQEKSLKSLERAAQDTTFKDMGNSVSALGEKFSAMSVVAIAAIGRITNKLMDMGENMLRSMSGVDQAMAGFSKYEDNISYQQTMLNNAAGLTEEEMTKLLDKLTWFSNETSFSASDMMQAMSKYIANGADPLVAQATALGTALWTALSGNTGESLAMANYNLPQIFGSGYMRLQDWKSIINAKMDTPWVREVFIKTAEELGELKKTAEGVWKAKNGTEVTVGNFTGSMTEGAWFTTNVLTTALAKFSKFTDEVYDEVQETGELTFDVIKRLGTDTEDLGYRSLKAAQETKTWTETWDYIKQATAAGWSETFETVIGSYSDARDFFSEMIESLYTLFVETGDIRNEFISGWAEYVPGAASAADDLADAIDGVASSQNKLDTLTKNASLKLKEYKDILYKVAAGDLDFSPAIQFQLPEESVKELQKIYKEVYKKGENGKLDFDFELLNEQLEELVKKEEEAAGRKYTKVIDGLEEVTEESITAREDLLSAVNTFLASMAELKSNIFDQFGSALGFSPEEFYEKITHPLAEFLRSFEDKVANVDLSFITPLVGAAHQLVEVIKNILYPFKQILGAIKSGIFGTFVDETTTLRGVLLKIQNSLAQIKVFTSKFKISEYHLRLLSEIVQGFLAPVKILWKLITSIASAIRVVFDSSNKKSKGLGETILEMVHGIAHFLTSLDEWLEKTGAIKKFVIPLFEFLAKVIRDAWSALKKFFGLEDQVNIFQNGLPTFEVLFGKWMHIKEWLHEHITQPINDAFGWNLHIPTWNEIFAGWEKFKKFVREKIIAPFEEITGIKVKWPSLEDLKTRWTQFKSWIHDNIVVPFEEASGIKLKWPTLDDMKAFFQKIKDFFSNSGTKKELSEEELAKKAEQKKKLWSWIGIVIGEIFNLIKMVVGYIGEFVGYIFGNKNLMSALEGGVAAVLVKSLFDMISNIGSLFESGKGLFENLNNVLGSFEKTQNTKAVKNLATSLLMIAISLLILASIPMDKVARALAVVVELVALLTGVMMATKTGVLQKGQRQAKSNSTILLKMAASIFIIAAAMKSISEIEDVEKLDQAALVIESLFAVVAMFAIMMQNSSRTLGKGEKTSQVSIQFLSIAVLILALASAIKKLSKIPNFSADSPAYLAVRNLLILVESMIIAIAAITSKSTGKGSGGASMVLAIYGIIALIVFLVVALSNIAKDFTARDVKEFIEITNVITKVIGVLAVLVLAIGAAVKLAKNGNAKNTKTLTSFMKTFIVIAVITVAIAAVITMLSSVPHPEAIMSAALAISTVLAVVALIAALILSTNIKASITSVATTAALLGVMAIVVASIAGSLSAVINAMGQNKISRLKKGSTDTIVDAALAIGAILIAVITLVEILANTNAKASITSMASMVVLLLILGHVVTVISDALANVLLAVAVTNRIGVGKKTDSAAGNLLMAAISISIILGVIGVLVGVLSQIKSVKGVLAAAVAIAIIGPVIEKIAIGISTILGATSIFKKSSSMVEAALSLVLVLTTMAILVAALSNITSVKGMLAASISIAIMAIAVERIALGLSAIVLALNGTSVTTTDVLSIAMSISALLFVIVGIAAIISDLESTSGMLKGALFLIMASVVILAISKGLSNLAQTAAGGTTSAIWVAVGAVSVLLMVLAAVAMLVSNEKYILGFVILGKTMGAFGKVLIGFAAALGVIIAAISMFKNSIAIIGEKAHEIETGVMVIFRALALGLGEFVKTFMPAILAAVGMLISWILTSIPEWLKQLLPVITTLVDFIFNVILSVLEKLTQYIGLIVGAIMKLVFSILDALAEWIGPLVVKLLDFIIQVIEGLAFAIISKGGQILAAIYDVITAIVGLVNIAISTLIGAILDAIGFGWLGDIIADSLESVSGKVADSLTKAGDKATKESDKLTAKLVRSNSRFAEQYAKVSEKTKKSVEQSTEGVTEACSTGGEKISSAASSAFNLGGIGSDINMGMDLDSITSFGESAGEEYSEGVSDGLQQFTVEDMFPSIDSYYKYGKDSAASERSGYSDALVTGLESGSLQTIEQYKEWLERTGASDDNIDAINDAIAKGTITNANFVEESLKIVHASDAATAAIRTQEQAIEDTKDILEAGSKVGAEYADNMNRDTGLQEVPKEVNDALNALYLLNETVTDASTVPEETRTSLANLRSVLSDYSGPQIESAIAIIDKLLGYTTGDVNGNAIKKYGADRKKAAEETRDYANALKEQSEASYEARVEQDKLNQERAENAERAAKAQDLFSKFVSIDSKVGEELYFMDQYEKLSDYYVTLFEDMIASPVAEALAINMLDAEKYQLYQWVKANRLDSQKRYNKHAKSAQETREIIESYYNDLIAAGKDSANSAAIQRWAQENKDLIWKRLVETGHMDAQVLARLLNDPTTLSLDQFTALMENVQRLGEEVGWQFVQGIVGAVEREQKTPQFIGASMGVGSQLARLTKNALEIKSPSRVGADIGKNFVLGIAEGVDENTAAGDAAEGNAISMVDRLKNALLSAVGINLDDIEPVIRPVLDLSEIVSGSDQINALLASGQVYRRGTGLGIGAVGYTDLNAIAQMNKIGLAQAIQESVLSQPVNQEINNTFNIQSNDPDVVARKVSAILSNQIQRKNQVWGPLKNYNVAQ